MTLLRAATCSLRAPSAAARFAASNPAPHNQLRGHSFSISGCEAAPLSPSVAATAGAGAGAGAGGGAAAGPLTPGLAAGPVLRLGTRHPHHGTRPATALAAMSSDAGGAASGSSPSGAIVVYVTVPNAEVGESLASKLVESKLAACVNLMPGVTSIYWWKGKVEKDPELLLIIKTREALLGKLTEFVRANHPYDEPEVIGLPILGGSPTYLQWLLNSASGSAAEAETDKAA